MTSETEETVLDLRKALHKALCKYRMSNMGDEDQVPYPLVDLCSNEGTTIDTGREELLLLADHLVSDAGVVAALSRAPEVLEPGDLRFVWSNVVPGDMDYWEAVFGFNGKDRAEAFRKRITALALSPQEGEAVAWRCLNVHGDAFLTEDANGAHFWLKSGKPVQPLYLHPSPEMGEISREEMTAVVRQWVSPAWCSVDRLVDAILSKLKENGLSREGLGGLARSQPGSDAQERSPVPPSQGGGANPSGGSGA